MIAVRWDLEYCNRPSHILRYQFHLFPSCSISDTNRMRAPPFLEFGACKVREPHWHVVNAQYRPGSPIAGQNRLSSAFVHQRIVYTYPAMPSKYAIWIAVATRREPANPAPSRSRQRSKQTHRRAHRSGSVSGNGCGCDVDGEAHRGAVSGTS